ncbi:MAG: hypothetical protein UT63_C0020G0008 [Candidatus Gottesmanbacteria bacterium GW2011_GWC2_39_8]|uniref:DegT/DnrJ/EryC1/StrS aminotransferase n=1 Tax=Candidatus Gottesmanbacteria bacterium GW2011_GWC2_39_8 TaxID=1618450 RepID=A0A0G0PZ82_9BACT|nr:MAG: hypothetical protein UT63_C0020G0008 [Candidatus Gottesmanbacteria bacterium GW2011_GWC2_39_8]
MNKAEWILKERMRVGALYDKVLKDVTGIKLVCIPANVESSPCHSQQVFNKYPDTVISKTDSFPKTDFVCKHHICLPLYPGLKDEEIEFVVNSLKDLITS